MPKMTTRNRCRQHWKRAINMIDHVLYHLQMLDNFYVERPEHQNVVRLISQMIVDAQTLAQRFLDEKA